MYVKVGYAAVSKTMNSPKPRGSRMSTVPDSEPLWTVREAAAFLRLGRNTVYEWAAAGKLPSLRLGSRVRFEPAALRRWLAVQRGPEAPVALLEPRRP